MRREIHHGDDSGIVQSRRPDDADNADYLNQQAARYRSPKLQELQKRNKDNADNLDDANWNKTRKEMRYDQHKSKVQQAY